VAGTQEYRALFVSEAQEILQALSDGALSWEKSGGGGATLINDLFRGAHTLKGMSATMGFDGLTRVCHTLEDALDSVRAGGPEPLGISDLLLASVDAMTRMVENVAGGGDSGAADPGLLARLEAAARPGSPGNALDSADAAKSEALPEDQRSRSAVDEARARGPVRMLTVRLEETCAFKGVRALLVRKAVERVAGVLATRPAGDAFEAGAFADTFSLWTGPEAGLPDLEKAALKVLEVAEATAVSVAPLTDASALPPAAAAGNEPAAVPPAKAEEAPAIAPAAPPSPPKVVPTQATLVTTDIAARETAAVPAAAGVSKPATFSEEEDATEGQASSASQRLSQTLRVSVERMDKVLDLVGELVTAKIRLSQIARATKNKELDETVAGFDHIVTELQEEVTAARMVPVDQIFSRYPRLIRDLSRELGKPMDLVLEGREIELDRSILEEIGEALVHLLRNAADHGVESTQERTAAGKPVVATIRVSARRDKNHVVIVVEDDGRGIDTQRIRAAAVRKGLLSEAAATALSEEEAMALILRPGFSTASKVTTLSGRGVGIDAVRAKAEALGGSLRFESLPGRGSRFRVRLPLSLAIIQALRVRVGAEEYLAPVANVAEAVECAPGELEMGPEGRVLRLREAALTVVPLDGLLGQARPGEPGLFTVLVVEAGDRRKGLIVDEVLGQEEVAVKNLGRHLKPVRGFGGVTILGDGSVCLILDLPALLEL
jgi:two-component system chemotaxis sensor kinase CheA